MKRAKLEPARDWEDPSVIGRNKRRAHVPLRSFPDQESALKYFTDNSSDQLSSCGIKLLSKQDWKFHLATRPEQVPANFSASDFDDKAWAKASPVSRKIQACVWGKFRTDTLLPVSRGVDTCAKQLGVPWL